MDPNTKRHITQMALLFSYIPTTHTPAWLIRLMINKFSTLALFTPVSSGGWSLDLLPYDLLLNIVEYLSVKDLINLRRDKTCRSLLQFSKLRSVWSQEDYGQFSVFKLDFPPLHPDVSISQVLDMRIDIPITGLFLERGLAGVVGPFHGGTAALQIYDWKTRQGILLDTGIKLEMDCDLDVIAFPEEIILYAEDSDNSVLHTYAIENIRRMLSLVAHHNPQTVARVGGGFPVQSDSSDSSEDESSSDNGSNSPSTMKISLPPKRSCQRRINDRGVGVFGAGYTMLKKSHISSRDRIPYNGKMSILTMSLRQLEEDNGQVRCLTHHFLTPLASPSSTPSTDTSGSSSTYLSANSSLSSPQQPLDDSPLEHTFAHTLEQNAIAKGPTGYDLVSFGEGGTGAIWLAHSQTSSTDSSDDDDESGEMDLEFWVATFASAKPNMVSQGYVRKLRLPRTINPSHTAALDIDDTQGVICIATKNVYL
ncbi:hypothetical protein RhiXN_07428 [Rhizoctonia solani]|uniref:F-box domain-containing protein n=1 Tax=Rhizoctonia solani TaxID=456999 RepID=A0A8H8T1L4_9AGAM|nr:uncharacterized protein RhiXN_07428 [Rhizoctonia solani]QRW25479.1 hypothetical protein RhiXN_07428 [Rhizoctonia solani]